MENRFFDTSDVKEKFALLISKLNEAGFLLDYINDTIIKSPFFDCFENNDLQDFMTLSFETITEKVFGKEVAYSYNHNHVNPYYWAGLNVMNIMMNYKIPLKRLLIVMPLKEIVDCFDLFHEMNEIQFCEYYVKIEKERNVLKTLRNEFDLSLSKISFLTELKPSLLNLIDKSNETLFSTSFRNLNRLSDLFNVSIDVFKKESNYLPYSSFMIRGNDLKPILLKNMLKYYGFNETSKLITVDGYLSDKEIRDLLSINEVVVDLSNPFGVIYISSRRIVRKYMINSEFAFIYKKSIEELKTQVNALLF